MKLIDQNEQLRADLAEREAEIACFRRLLERSWSIQYLDGGNMRCEVEQALSTPTSTSYLEQWEKSRFGEPVAWSHNNGHIQSDGIGVPTHLYTVELGWTPLYARKEK